MELENPAMGNLMERYILIMNSYWFDQPPDAIGTREALENLIKIYPPGVWSIWDMTTQQTIRLS